MELALTVGANETNPVEGDLDLLDGQLHLLDGADAVAQHLRVRFRFFLGEWFLNQLEGVPYFDEVLVKNPSIPAVKSLFREIILETPGIEALRVFELTIDRTTRALDMRFEAQLSSGETLAADYGDFVVGVI